MKNLVGLLFVIITGVTTLFAADFLPLDSGNTWTYRDSATGASFTVGVGSPMFINGNAYHPLIGYADRPLWVRRENGQLLFWNDDAGIDSVLTSWIASPVPWPAPERDCSPLGQTEEKQDVLEIQYRTSFCADHGLESEQYAENIGMVRRVVQTIAGPRTFDLVHARVGNQLILPGDRGGITLTVEPAVGKPSWFATFHLDLGNGPDMILGFTSGQEFDAALRDADGNIVWVWSADKLFIQALHERRIAGEWKETFEVPYPPAIPEGGVNFVLEVWITNAPGQPKFATAAPISIPRLQPN